MKKHFKKTAASLAVLGGMAGQAFAITSVDVRVTGTITPVACTPVIGGGGTVDYGSISPDTLSDTAFTDLGIKEIPFQITCDAKAPVAIKALSQRPGSVAGGSEWANGISDAPTPLFSPYVAGLGMNGTEKIGGYSMGITPGSVTLDGVASDTIVRAGGNVTWSASPTGGLFWTFGESHQSWSKTGTVVPEPFQIMSGTLRVQAYINKKSELTVTSPIALDGLATIELVYL